MASPDLGLLLPALRDFVLSTKAALRLFFLAFGDFLSYVNAALGLLFPSLGDFAASTKAAFVTLISILWRFHGFYQCRLWTLNA